MLDLDAVVVVMTLAREGSLAGASRALGQPRSTLTRRLEQLERDLGVRLVERTSRHFRLTEAGHRLVERGAAVVDAARQVEATLQAGRRMRLRIAAPPGLGLDVLQPFLRFDEQNVADLGFEFVFTDRQLHPIRDDFDLVASFAPPTDGDLFCQTVERFRWQCVASAAYLERYGSPATPADLTAHACIALDVHGGISPYAWPLYTGGVQHLDPRFISTSMSAVLEMIFADQGIGLLPADFSFRMRELVAVLPSQIGAEGKLYLSMGQRLSDTERGRRVRAFVDRFQAYEAMLESGQDPTSPPK
ncbi:MAG: LysR family transcriptional regulator [Myxococcota bacterium]